MVALLAQAITGEANENNDSGPLLTTLRERFKVALVDEFQDTDMQQWAIFKHIFVNNSEKTGCRLIIVGDPKQAIYRFRGADLNAYFMARDQLRKLGTKLTRTYSLDTNWRSMPNLIEGFNALFRDDHWFPSEDGINYRQALIPDVKYRRTRLYKDNSSRSALITFELDASLKAPEARNKWYQIIAEEIKHLLNSETDMMVFGNINSSPRNLRADDICILFRNKNEAPHIEKALNDFQIQYSYYKKPGLYKSVEALELAYLLKAIANPSDTAAFRKALLTSFFSIPLTSLSLYDNLSPDHSIKMLFAKWTTQSITRHWPGMFRSILEDTGVLFRDRDDTN